MNMTKNNEKYEGRKWPKCPNCGIQFTTGDVFSNGDYGKHGRDFLMACKCGCWTTVIREYEGKKVQKQWIFDYYIEKKAADRYNNRPKEERTYQFVYYKQGSKGRMKKVKDKRIGYDAASQIYGSQVSKLKIQEHILAGVEGEPESEAWLWRMTNKRPKSSLKGMLLRKV